VGDIDLHYLSQCYGRAFVGCELIVPGGNRTYRLVAGGNTYYLRLYRPVGRSPAQIAFELHLLREVRPTPGINVARPIRTVDGADCARISFGGVDRAACLFHALDGRLITDDPEDVALFGSALAKLHAALAGIDGGGVRPLDPGALCAHGVVLTRIPGSGAARRAVDRCRLEMLGDPMAHGLPSGNCHGDARLGNAVVRDGTVGFFDFDDCGYGPYLLDLGTAAWWHFVAGNPSRTATLVAALLRGYEMERPLSRAERRALPHYVKLAQVRALLFLAEFCVLEDGLWPRVLDRATNLLERELTI
jgi:Ser/Thr protein kinase RdoA (MazF antagonist)